MTLSSEHKSKISAALSVETPELVARIRELRDSMSLRVMAVELNIGYATLSRIIKKHNITLSDTGRVRAAKASRDGQIGNVPWNKGGHLADETKEKISKALVGRPGHRMTAKQKEKWRETYFANGVHQFRLWLQSEDGQRAASKALAATTTHAFKVQCSQRTADLVASGCIKTNRGRGSHLDTVKGGSFYTKSSYETHYVTMLEDNQNVVRFFYEPLQIPYEFNGAQLMYTPDFLVEYTDGREELIEIKPKRLIALPKNTAKIAAARQGTISFRIVTEEELYGGPN